MGTRRLAVGRALGKREALVFRAAGPLGIGTSSVSSSLTAGTAFRRFRGLESSPSTSSPSGSGRVLRLTRVPALPLATRPVSPAVRFEGIVVDVVVEVVRARGTVAATRVDGSVVLDWPGFADVVAGAVAVALAFVTRRTGSPSLSVRLGGRASTALLLAILDGLADMVALGTGGAASATGSS